MGEEGRLRSVCMLIQLAMNRLSILILLILGLSLSNAWNISVSPNEERLHNRRAGDNFLVVCKVKDFDGAASDVNIEWYRDETLIPRFGSTMTIERTYSNQLMINRPKTADGGKYTCKAEIHGEKQEISVDITFVDPPQFIDPQIEQHPEEGTRAEIFCQVSGTDQLEVFWQFNGVTLDETSQRGYEFSESHQTLYIPNFTAKRDDGIYNCNAAQYSSFETLSINVTGYARPTITVFDVPSGNRGMEGQTIELKCGAVGKPKPSYKWYFEGEEKPLVHTDKHNVEDGLLIIESLGSEDAGTYTCVAENIVGKEEKAVELSIFMKPKVDIQPEYVKKEGENVEIICNYHGEGELAAKFVYGSQELKVTNKAGEVNSQSEEHESTDSDSGMESSDNDEDLNEETTTQELTSTEPEEHEENMRWKRFIDDVNSQRISIREEENQLILTVKQLSLEDALAYKCIVSNEAGITEKTSQLNIIHPPTLRHYTGKTVRSFEGNTVSLYCDVSAVPEPKWTWLKNGETIEANGASIQIDNHQTISKLTLQNTDDSDNYGTYTCSADNGVGVLEKNIEVLHIVRPATPKGINCKNLIYPNYGKCSFVEGLYDDESSKPLKMEFLIAKMDEMESDFDWKDALVVTVDFENETIIPNLTPNSHYIVKARATNEAGDSEYSEETSLETTEAWAPQSPKSVKMECSESCIVSWEKPNDHGSPILNYKITIQEMGHGKNEEEEQKEESSKTNYDVLSGSETGEYAADHESKNEVEQDSLEVEEPLKLDTSSTVSPSDSEKETSYEESAEEKVPIGKPFVIEVGADETEILLAHIKSHSFYRISVSAFNAVGQGESLEIEHQTDESPTSNQETMDSSNLILAGIFGILLILLIIDFICFLANRCGVIACICLNCGRSSSRKQRDLEAGNGPENNRLLESSGTSWKTPITTTV